MADELEENRTMSEIKYEIIAPFVLRTSPPNSEEHGIWGRRI